MRVALYVRVSTDEQAQSAETQERGALGWCAAQGHTVITTYRDIGHSGAEWVHRPGILDLQRDAQLHPRPWDIVVVRDVDRLGRDQVRLPVLLSTLADAGIQVVESSTGQTVALDTMGQFVAAVRAFVAQTEREQIAHRVRTAHAQQHREGRVVGGVCYGYQNLRGPQGVRYAIDPAQADVVREIFARAGQGEGYRTIAFALNARKVPPPSAGARGTGSWSPGAVYEVVRRERYRGVLAWGATKKGYRGGTRHRTQGPEVVRLEVPELAIVTPEVWEAAQRHRDVARKATGRGGYRVGVKHLLIGYAVCAACGGPIASTATRSGTVTVPAYCCGWRRDRGVCGAGWRRRTESLDGPVRDWLLEHVIDASVLRDAVAEARRRLTSTETDPQVETLRAEEREASTAVGRLVTAIEHGGDVPELVARLQERRTRLEGIRRELEARAMPLEGIPFDVDRALEGAVANLRDVLTADGSGARGILGAVLVGRMKVSWEGPGGRVWIEGVAEMGGVLRAVLAGNEGVTGVPWGTSATPSSTIPGVSQHPFCVGAR